MARHDPVRDALAPLATEAFPTLYQPQPSVAALVAPAGRASALPGLSVQLDLQGKEMFLRAIQEDDLLRQFAEAGEQGVFISASTGTGWRIQASQLAAAIIDSAAFRVLARARATEDLEVLLSELDSVLGAFRRLLAGEEDEAIVLTAFEGVSVAEGVRVSTPWGDLRSATEVERLMKPFGEGTPTAVLESQVPVRFQVGDPSPDEPLGGFDEPLATNVQMWGTLMPVAVLLAVEDENFAVADHVWQTTILPVQTGWSFSGPRSPRLFARGPGKLLTEAQCDALAQWSKRLDDHHHASIDVALTRVLSAVRDRNDAQDALIDAVVAWENLFGHGGETEVVFRVTTALALLLESEPERRKKKRSELGKVYSLRSKVIHGAEIATKDNLPEAKELAVHTAVEALRILFRDNAELISDRERGLRLILA